MPKTISQLIREGYAEERQALAELSRLVSVQADVTLGLIDAVTLMNKMLGEELTKISGKLDRLGKK